MQKKWSRNKNEGRKCKKIPWIKRTVKATHDCFHIFITSLFGCEYLLIISHYWIPKTFFWLYLDGVQMCRYFHLRLKFILYVLFGVFSSFISRWWMTYYVCLLVLESGKRKTGALDLINRQKSSFYCRNRKKKIFLILIQIESELNDNQPTITHMCSLFSVQIVFLRSSV